MVKAQVPVGGRGKAGGILRCTARSQVSEATLRLFGTRLEGTWLHVGTPEAIRDAEAAIERSIQ